MTTRMDARVTMACDRDGRRSPRRQGRAAARRASASCSPTRSSPKIDYKNPQILRSFVTDRGKMIPRRISGASARQQRVISTAIRRARMLALLPFSVTRRLSHGDANHPHAGRRRTSARPASSSRSSPATAATTSCPRGFAVSATVRNKNRLDHEKAVIERRSPRSARRATEIARPHQRHDAAVRAHGRRGREAVRLGHQPRHRRSSSRRRASRSITAGSSSTSRSRRSASTRCPSGSRRASSRP